MAIDPLKLSASKLETTFEGDDVVVHTSYEADRAVKRRMVEVKSRWKRIRELGSGTFGVVWLEEKEGGGKRAVKSLFRQLMSAQKIDYSRELQALVELREHKRFFVEFLGWYEDKEYIYLAMEYIEHGDLAQYLKQFGPKVKLDATEITRQLLEGLEILHRKRICHRDLKPQNVLVASIYPIWVKIADFGVSKRDKGTTLKTRFGTMGYQAPELLGLFKMGTSYTKAVDIWALGCLIHEVLTFETPFLGRVSGTVWTGISGSHIGYTETDMNLLRDYCEGKHEFPTEVLRKSQVSEEGIGFVKGLLAADPCSRVSIGDALRSPWLVRRCREEGDTEGLRKNLLSLGVRGISLEMAAVLLDNGWGDDLIHCLSSIKTIHGATEEEYKFVFSTLLKVTGNPNFRILSSWTLLQLAARSGRQGVVKLLLGSSADVNAKPATKHGRTALQAAAAAGHLGIVRLFLGHGADINAKPAQYHGRTALQAAAEGGHLDTVKLLLGRGANINAEPAPDCGRTALQAAAGGGHLDTVRLLLDSGADINAKPAQYHGRTALQVAAGGGYLDTVRLLLGRGANINAEPAPDGGRTALQAAAGGGHLDTARLLLGSGADINAKPAKYHGRTALQAAAEGGHLDTVRLLLDRRADINAKPAEYYGRTALQAAAEGGHLDTVRLLLDRRADINAEPAEYYGRTALQAAAGGGYLETTRLLLDFRADINAKPAEYYGRTALQAAAGEGHLETVRLLLNCGANINAKPAPYHSEAALQAAESGGHLGVLKLLLDCGAR